MTNFIAFLKCASVEFCVFDYLSISFTQKVIAHTKYGTQLKIIWIVSFFGKIFTSSEKVCTLIRSHDMFVNQKFAYPTKVQNFLFYTV